MIHYRVISGLLFFLCEERLLILDGKRMFADFYLFIYGFVFDSLINEPERNMIGLLIITYLFMVLCLLSILVIRFGTNW